MIKAGDVVWFRTDGSWTLVYVRKVREHRIFFEAPSMLGFARSHYFVERHENRHQSKHEGLFTLWEAAQGVSHEGGLQGCELHYLWSGADSEASQCGSARSQISQSLSTWEMDN